MRTIASITAACLVASCATVAPMPDSSYSLIDPKGVDMAAYDRDWNECASLANQADQAKRAADQAAAGAVAGAIFGALIGIAVGGNRSWAGYGAGIGAANGLATGAAHGAVAAHVDQQITLRNCLTGRGYRVIR